MTSNQQCVYESLISSANSAVAFWSFYARENCNTKVIPDGCRDIIVVEKSDLKSPIWFVSELSDSIYDVDSCAGDKMRGIRLEPGTQIDQLALNQWAKTRSIDELFIGDQIDEFCERSTSLVGALQCLCNNEIDSVQKAAHELGVSPRTLQRLIKSETQRTPCFWLSLARARQAVKALYKFDLLIDVAFACNFSDQAHMAREMKRWFDLSPSQIKRSPELLSLLSEPGYV